MAPKRQPDWAMYKEYVLEPAARIQRTPSDVLYRSISFPRQMDFLCFGDALWEPSPTSGYTRIKIGDVGFIRSGQFHLLFSASSPSEGQDVPTTFEQLDIGTPEPKQPRQPGCRGTHSVRQVTANAGISVSGNLPLEAGVNFSYELTEDHGAALVTRHLTYRMDALVEFESYTKRHYESWVAFARDRRRYGRDVQPVLVSGFDMTKDFAMVAYSDDTTSSGANCIISVPNLGSASASTYCTWETKCSPHRNCGPQPGRNPLPRSRAIESSSSQPAEAEDIPDEFNQCVFIRYYTMQSRKIFGMKVIRAGAGPHDLGSGDHEGDTFPELTVQPNDELSTSGEGFEEQWDPHAGDNNPEPDVVVHNAQFGHSSPFRYQCCW
ncbi:hypothetical protein BJ322DRAFT_1163397 [Thelephora terrestris]|uniref:Uncharacterized protein n=1 Tax=Thelephora terrestris TaxID=56493 RepID=A0A9P6L2Q9_9AGAM|nr:hypothetical protein BJ322DRAFT_1163397 [Thelephora terrestris]